MTILVPELFKELDGAVPSQQLNFFSCPIMLFMLPSYGDRLQHTSINLLNIKFHLRIGILVNPNG